MVNDKTFISDKISASLSKSEDLITHSEHHLATYYYRIILRFASFIFVLTSR